MSGGSLDYVYGRVDEAACNILSRTNATPLQRAFATHLQQVAVALKALEWVYSGDKGPGDEVAALQAVLAPDAEVGAATAKAQVVLRELQALLARNDAVDGPAEGDERELNRKARHAYAAHGRELWRLIGVSQRAWDQLERSERACWLAAMQEVRSP